ncbi:efflux RND transporter periplasmic adaptor subunit [Herminiimonas contaminans]|uniref:Efflux RND transporter periplasmic adaptor subunit n=1 Tax=Herminiimonas contaminans TaxID=1111140 RepID=A0ABS0ETW3_9BURK|nr:efflux RND transporter periplasmic adaptor subunit [Herminiimonas contaminans]MBF8178160.1 efflux RND transporter periplasmic adaptor subunit [Herminiimonas contaminans]
MKRFNKKTIVIAVVAVLVLAGIVLVVGGGKSDAKKKDETGPKPALAVTTVQPSQASLPIYLTANGTVTAWQEAIIGSESNGLKLTDVRVNVGDVVKRGQVLATFSVASVNAELAQARASLMEAEANAADAKNNAERARTLETTGALSTQQINQYLTTEQTAKAKAEAAKALLAVQEVRLSQTQVVASDDGVISARSATVGAVVSAGTELFRLIRQGRLEWRAEVTSAELGRIKTGTVALITAANGTQVKGKVRMIAPTVDAQNRAALVYVDLAPTAADVAPVRAGMFATGQFDLGNSTAVTVPQQTIVIRDGFSYVFRMNPDNRVTQIKVQPGRRLADRIEIISGVPTDAVLVANGAGFLNDGDLVKVVVDTPATADSTKEQKVATPPVGATAATK